MKIISKTRKCTNCKKELDKSLIVCTGCGTAIVKRSHFLRNLFLSFFISIIVFSFLYFVLLMHITFLNKLINLVIIYVGILNISYIILKYVDYKNQQKAFNVLKSNEALELIMSEEGIKINKTEEILFKLFNLLKESKFFNILDLFIFERIRKTLYFLKAVPNRSDILSIMSYQGDIEYNSLKTEFKVLKVFNWALPTLGFLGTVIGISGAISYFSSFLQQAGQTEITSEGIKDSLTHVLINLALAFDSTMIALFLLLIMLPIGVYLENNFETLLNQIEDYCLTFISPNIVFDKKDNIEN